MKNKWTIWMFAALFISTFAWAQDLDNVLAIRIRENVINNGHVGLSRAIRNKVSRDVLAGRINVFLHEYDEIIEGGLGRRTWCVEYSNPSQLKTAASHFEKIVRRYDMVALSTEERCEH